MKAKPVDVEWHAHLLSSHDRSSGQDQEVMTAQVCNNCRRKCSGAE
jgi:hypothetical protein